MSDDDDFMQDSGDEEYASGPRLLSASLTG
jgi:hypothetical protein